MRMEPLIKEIGNDKFEIMPLPAKKSIKILLRLSKIIGGAVGKSGIKLNPVDVKKDTKESKDKKGLMDSDIDFGSMLSGLFERLDEDIVITTVEEILVHVGKYNEKTQGYGKVTLDVDFAGNLGQLFEVLKESLMYNYSDFLSGALGLIKKVSPGK